MKNYFLFFCVALFTLSSISCSKNKKMSPKKTEETVKEYIKKEIADANTYESIAFGKLDSIRLKDTEVYKKTNEEKIRLENSVHSLYERMHAMEQSGVQQADRLYIDLKEKAEEEEIKLKKVEEKMKLYEKEANEYVYSLNHKYKARKHHNGPVVVYEETFYIDKNNHVIEDVTIYEY